MRWALVLSVVAVAGCAAERQNVAGREGMLAAAGFTVRPADTAARQAELRTLPPHRFVTQAGNGKTVYLYPDPTQCGCLYIGSEPAYQQYQRMAVQAELADEQPAAAPMAMDRWNWAPWGPGWW